MSTAPAEFLNRIADTFLKSGAFPGAQLQWVKEALVVYHQANDHLNESMRWYSPMPKKSRDGAYGLHVNFLGVAAVKKLVDACEQIDAYLEGEFSQAERDALSALRLYSTDLLNTISCLMGICLRLHRREEGTGRYGVSEWMTDIREYRSLIALHMTAAERFAEMMATWACTPECHSRLSKPTLSLNLDRPKRHVVSTQPKVEDVAPPVPEEEVPPANTPEFAAWVERVLDEDEAEAKRKAELPCAVIGSSDSQNANHRESAVGEQQPRAATGPTTATFRQSWICARQHLQQSGADQIKWLRCDLTWPFAEHLSFRMGNQLFFVYVETARPDDDPGTKDLFLQLAKEATAVPALMPMEVVGKTYQPIYGGWGLRHAESGGAVDPPSLVSDAQIEMSQWELQDFSVQVVRTHIEKSGGTILSTQPSPHIDPAIWFGDESGPAYVVVRCDRYPVTDARRPDNAEAISASCEQESLRGYFASVTIANSAQPHAPDSGPLPLCRGHGMLVNFTGLEPLLRAPREETQQADPMQPQTEPLDDMVEIDDVIVFTAASPRARKLNRIACSCGAVCQDVEVEMAVTMLEYNLRANPLAAFRFKCQTCGKSNSLSYANLDSLRDEDDRCTDLPGNFAWVLILCEIATAEAMNDRGFIGERVLVRIEQSDSDEWTGQLASRSHFAAGLALGDRIGGRHMNSHLVALTVFSGADAHELPVECPRDPGDIGTFFLPKELDSTHLQSANPFCRNPSCNHIFGIRYSEFCESVHREVMPRDLSLGAGSTAYTIMTCEICATSCVIDEATFQDLYKV